MSELQKSQDSNDVILNKIEIWKKRLLDMSFANPMLNFRFPKAASVTFHEDAGTLWEKLVRDRRTLDFPFAGGAPASGESETWTGKRRRGSVKTGAASTSAAAAPGTPPVPEKSSAVAAPGEADWAKNDDLWVECGVTDLQKLLKNISKKGRQFQDDKGVNVVYISAGFIRWREKPGSQDWFLSPLLMVPAELVSRTVFSAFSMKLGGGGIVVNPTLQYKLSHDYGADLPEYEEDTSYGDYIASVAAVLEKYTGSAFGWEITSQTALGLFPFANICIYRDLEANSARIAASPLIRGICGDFSENSLLNSYARIIQKLQSRPMDEICLPDNTFQVVDADSSQQEAVLCANQGISFVLQGPPGTGKSQTITNIIADALARNRRVLFVSEKKAALDVVYERLEETGLGEFCLVLHSDKTTSREFSQQLFDVYEMLQASDTSHATAGARTLLEELRSLREQNNFHALILHEPLTGLRRSVYEVLGELASLSQAPDVLFPFDRLGTLSWEGYQGICSALEGYARILGRSGARAADNPWDGNVLTSADGACRQELGVILPKLEDAASRAAAFLRELGEAGFEVSATPAGFGRTLVYIRAASRASDVPECWHDQAVFDRLDDEIAIGRRQQEDFRKCLSFLRDSAAEINEISAARRTPVVLDNAQERHSVEDLTRQQEIVDGFFARSELMKVWASQPDPARIGAALDLIEATREQGGDLRRELERTFEKEFFDLRAGPLCREFRESRGGLFKSFRSGYKDTITTIKKLYRGSEAVDDEHVIRWLEQLGQLQESETDLRNRSGEMETLFGSHWNGAGTDTGLLRGEYDLFSRLTAHRDQIRYALDVLRLSEQDAERLREHFQGAFHGLDTDWATIEDVYSAFATVRSGGGAVCGQAACGVISRHGREPDAWAEVLGEAGKVFDRSCLDTLSLDGFAKKISACQENFALLEESIDCRTSMASCAGFGLTPAIEAMAAAGIGPEQYLDAFRKRICNLWLDLVYASVPSLASFRHDDQDRRIARFRQLDQLQFAIARDRVRAAAVNHFKDAFNTADPARSARFNEAAALLRSEHNKKRRHLPVRTMFSRMPELILQLKPCVMMSPLSVSNFLCAGDCEFDLVIFDEASQLRTESAIGSIFRGKQVIVAGDRHQMPPTNFFNATMDDPDDGTSEEYSDTDAYESLLDEAHALYDMTLRWHYRSKHESLIAFSNENIYGGKLVTFPSSTVKRPDVGVEYVLVEDGVYYPASNRPNPREAEKVADLVFSHFEKYPKRSIGVIAFGMKQQACIEAAVAARLRDRPECASFFSESASKPFFVKSLENVQGDERDTIILDIGYAKNESGKMIMNFGPLSNDGGERRLNVAITRAKYNLKLVGSIQPEDIAVEKVSKAGPRLLRDYIRFAMNGGVTDRVLLSEGSAGGSRLEDSVCSFLESKGYDVARQVGTSSLRIDLAVKDPGGSGQYVLGIDCDGRHYGEARTARDRDRTRQSVLGLMGWKLYQVWSVSWVRNPDEERRRLLEAVETALKGGDPSQVSVQVTFPALGSYTEKGAPEVIPDITVPEADTGVQRRIPIQLTSQASESVPGSNEGASAGRDAVPENSSPVSGGGSTTPEYILSPSPASAFGTPGFGSGAAVKEQGDAARNCDSLFSPGAGSSGVPETARDINVVMGGSAGSDTAGKDAGKCASQGCGDAARAAAAPRRISFPAYAETLVEGDPRECIRKVAVAESPIHLDYLSERFRRAGIMQDLPAARISQQIDRKIMSISDVVLKGKFVYFKGQSSVTPRQAGLRGGAEFIAPEELEAGLRAVLSSLPGNPDRKEVLDGAVNAFGLQGDPGAREILEQSLRKIV